MTETIPTGFNGGVGKPRLTAREANETAKIPIYKLGEQKWEGSVKGQEAPVRRIQRANWSSDCEVGDHAFRRCVNLSFVCSESFGQLVRATSCEQVKRARTAASGIRSAAE